jgi:hypothetical protein
MILNQSSGHTTDDVLGAIGLGENSDEVVCGLASQVIRGVQDWPSEAVAKFLDDMAAGTLLPDPYRGGVVAWLLGCLCEFGHSTVLARQAVLEWLDMVLVQAAILADRVYESLPKGSLCTQEEFDARRTALETLLPLESRAWEALTRFYTAATTILTLCPETRPTVQHLRKILENLRHHPTCHYVAGLLQVPKDELFLVLEPEFQRGLVVRLSNIENSFQLLAIVSDLYCKTFQQPARAISESTCDMAYGAPPQHQTSPEAEPFQTNWMMFNWRAIQEDLQTPEPNQSPLDEWMGSKRHFVESDPWDLDRFGGYRVLLLRWSSINNIYWWARTYLQLKPEAEIKAVLAEAQVTEWLERLRLFTRLGTRFLPSAAEPEIEHTEVFAGIKKDLNERTYEAFLVRAVRRMIPFIRQQWRPLPFEWFAVLARALNLFEHDIFSGSAAVGDETREQVQEVSDRVYKAAEARYTSTVPQNALSAVRMLITKNSVAEPRHLVLSLTEEIWKEAIFQAQQAGRNPLERQFRDVLLADRAWLTELGTQHPEGVPFAEVRAQDLWPNGRPEWWPLSSEYPLPGIDYEVAISVAGEDRAHARPLASLLLQRGCRVFYDESERDELLGQELSPFLQSVYRDRSLMCVVFVSENYAGKPWTQREWQVISGRMQSRQPDFLLPIRLDDIVLSGLSEEIAYLDVRKLDEPSLFAMVCSSVERRLARAWDAGSADSSQTSATAAPKQ